MSATRVTQYIYDHDGKRMARRADIGQTGAFAARLERVHTQARARAARKAAAVINRLFAVEHVEAARIGLLRATSAGRTRGTLLSGGTREGAKAHGLLFGPDGVDTRVVARLAPLAIHHRAVVTDMLRRAVAAAFGPAATVTRVCAADTHMAVDLDWGQSGLGSVNTVAAEFVDKSDSETESE